MDDAVKKLIVLVISLAEAHELSTNLEEMVSWRDRWSRADDEAFSAIDKVSDMHEEKRDSLNADDAGVVDLLECWHMISEENTRELDEYLLATGFFDEGPPLQR